MTERIEIATDPPYGVQIGDGLLASLGQQIRAAGATGATGVLVADDLVQKLYGQTAAAALAQAGFGVCSYTFPNGEKAKTLTTVEAILQVLCANRISQGDFLVALGGGVTGDLTGLAAALYRRGIPYYQAPTTVLAAVDASVGGKTAVNLPGGKNLAGAFYQPRGVFCDCRTFATLPTEIFAQGMAEVIKYGMLADAALFDWVKSGSLTVPAPTMVARCVAIKAAYVTADAYDQGQRRLLNFGHTFGHALEQCSGYRLPHGQAVAIGMTMMTKAAYRLGFSPVDCTPPLRQALQAWGLPVETPFVREQMLQALVQDKKRSGDWLTLVLPQKIGVCQLKQVSVAELPLWLDAAC